MKKLLTGIAVMFIAITAFARISYAATPEVNSRVQQILPTIVNGSMTDEQKVRAVVEYITSTTVYNSAYDGVTYDGYYEVPVDSRADGPILYGHGICTGYSDAFKAFMDACGIPCLVCISITNEHAWNIVAINGQLLEVDTSVNGGAAANIFTLLTTTKMASMHNFVAEYIGTLEDFYAQQSQMNM